MRIDYLGPERTFTERVTGEFFPGENLNPVGLIRTVVNNVESGKADYGVVPAENFYNGEVKELLDSLVEVESVRILKDKGATIVHCLGALKPHGHISRVLSKDQALEQCSKYLSKNYPDIETVAVSSTAMAARKIAENGYRDALAIASEPALVKYGLDVLERDICKNNRTRFVVLGKDPVERTGNDRTFLAVHPLIKDKAGTLFDSLGFFAKREINLSAQMSRPDGNGGYWFYLEADGHISDPNMVDAVSGLKKYLNPEHKHEEVVKVLGGCRNTNWKDED